MWQIQLLENWRASFLWQRKNVTWESLFACTTHHRKFATYPEVGNGFFGFVFTVHSRFWRIGERVFNIVFAVFIHEQISLSQKTCHRKFCSCGLGLNQRLSVIVSHECPSHCGNPLAKIQYDKSYKQISWFKTAIVQIIFHFLLPVSIPWLLLIRIIRHDPSGCTS